LKDGSKTNSQRAARFLPVDMKDRLKSAFNRAGVAPENAPPEDGPDYTAIFNPNRAASAQTNPRLAGASMSGSQVADASAGVREAAQDIEEAEIVAESEGNPAAELSGFSAILKSDKSRASDLKTAQRQIEPPGGTTAHPDHSRQPEVDAPSDNSKNEGAVSQKSKSRFFGDFSSTESVRLKVEKRNEKRPEVIPMASAASPAEVSVLGAERGAAAVFALENDPPELAKLPTNGNHAIAAGVAAEPARSEQAHINLLEEYDSMDANEHESGNGAAAATVGEVDAAAIVIERNSKFSGQLKFAGAITIEGQVDGGLIAERIVVREGGVVNASIDGNTVTIAGTVKGDVSARGELEILASGVVDGSVTAPAITVRRGGRVEGLCSIGVPRA
jgi:cytoskeletal protein CcmA (bactofilin family)